MGWFLAYKIDFESQILALSDTSLITQFSKFNNILWVCWFTDKNPFENFTTRIAILYTAVWHQKQACYYDWALAFGLKATKCGIRIDRRTLYNLTRNLFIDTYMKVQPYFNVSLACTLRKLLASAFKLSEFSVKMIGVMTLRGLRTLEKVGGKFCILGWERVIERWKYHLDIKIE